MQTINTRIANLEKKLTRRDGACSCPVKRFFVVSPDATEAEIAEHYPDNRRYCPVCGGLNETDEVFKAELGL